MSLADEEYFEDVGGFDSGREEHRATLAYIVTVTLHDGHTTGDRQRAYPESNLLDQSHHNIEEISV